MRTTFLDPSALKAGRRHKYRAIRVRVDGHLFPSKAEAARYVELTAMRDEGRIMALTLQPRWLLHGPNGKKVGRYTADFQYSYVSRSGMPRIVTEDVKGRKPPGLVQRLKHVADEYGIRVELVAMDYKRVNELLALAAAQGRVTPMEEDNQ